LSWIYADGRRLFTGDGRQIQLRGCNVGGWLLIEPHILGLENHPTIESEKDLWDRLEHRFGEKDKLALIRVFRNEFFTEDDVRRAAAAGFNCLRIPVWWRAVADTKYGGDPEYLDRAVRWCARHGMYAIIALHGAPGGQSRGDERLGEYCRGELWRREVCQKQTVQWWRALAERYRGEPAVAGYDLLNEPNPPARSNLVEIYDQLYDAIRAVDQRHIIIMQNGRLDLNLLPRPADLGWSNVVYSFHYYPASAAEASASADILWPAWQRLAHYCDVPILVGEFNTLPPDHGGLDFLALWRHIYDHLGWSWIFWTYKKIEVDRATYQGWHGYYAELPRLDPEADTLEGLYAVFRRFNTRWSEAHPLLTAALLSPWPSGGETAPPLAPRRRIALPLSDCLVMPSASGTVQVEWRFEPPRIVSRSRADGDRVCWALTVPTAGAYELWLRMAAVATNERLTVWMDGVEAANAAVPATGAWEQYADFMAARLFVSAGRHIMELSPAGDHVADGFMNLQAAWLEPADGVAEPPSGARLRLGPINVALPLASDSLYIEWNNNPPNFTGWSSGEEVEWQIDLPAGGTYDIAVIYGSSQRATCITVLLDGSPVSKQTLKSTGGRQAYTEAWIGTVTLPAGRHRLGVCWENTSGNETGNLREVKMFRRRTERGTAS